jgi:hypothetical protein
MFDHDKLLNDKLLELLNAPEGPVWPLINGGGILHTCLADPIMAAKLPAYLMERTSSIEQSKKNRSWNKRRMVVEVTDGGFIKRAACNLEPRTENRRSRLATQHKEQRTCVQDALYQFLVAREVNVVIDEVRAIHRTDENCPLLVAQQYVTNKFNLTLERVTSQFALKGGPALAILQRTGLYLVQVSVFLEKKDPTPDNHWVFYSGSVLIDNQKNSKVIVIEEKDRQDTKAERAVFQTIDPKMQVRIANVYQLLLKNVRTRF